MRSADETLKVTEQQIMSSHQRSNMESAHKRENVDPTGYEPNSRQSVRWSSALRSSARESNTVSRIEARGCELMMTTVRVVAGRFDAEESGSGYDKSDWCALLVVELGHKMQEAWSCSRNQ